jgi:hypothetical protein
MSQMGHSSAALALEVYAEKMACSHDTGELKALTEEDAAVR